MKLFRIPADLSSKSLAAPNLAVVDPGMVEGYAATWDNVDELGETFRKGAFRRSLGQKADAEGNIPEGRIPLMSYHASKGGDAANVIGSVIWAKEDDHGLKFRAKFAADDESQAIRQKVLDSHIKFTSVGYKVIQKQRGMAEGKSVIELLEAAFWEVTLTAFPVNPLAEITDAKSQTANTEKPDPIAEALKVFTQTVSELKESFAKVAEERLQVVEGKTQHQDSTHAEEKKAPAPDHSVKLLLSSAKARLHALSHGVCTNGHQGASG